MLKYVTTLLYRYKKQCVLPPSIPPPLFFKCECRYLKDLCFHCLSNIVHNSWHTGHEMTGAISWIFQKLLEFCTTSFQDFAHAMIVHQLLKIAVLSDKDIFPYSVGQADKQLIERLPKFGKSFFGYHPSGFRCRVDVDRKHLPNSWARTAVSSFQVIGFCLYTGKREYGAGACFKINSSYLQTDVTDKVKKYVSKSQINVFYNAICFMLYAV